MNYILTAQEAKYCDNYTITKIGIPSFVLMERAALSCVEELEKRFDCSKKQHVLCVAGRGNNGADALAIARILSERGWKISVYLTEPDKRRTEENRYQKSLLSRYPVSFVTKPEEGEYTILIDGIFGVGFSGKLSKDIEELLVWLNTYNAYRFAIDIPSGVNTDDGSCDLGFKADCTVTFEYLKRGLLLYPGAELAGEVIQKRIGLYRDCWGKTAPGMLSIDGHPDYVMPKRKKDGNKGSFGKCLLAVGSDAYPGAAVLSAKACYRSGAGMVKVCSDTGVKSILVPAIPEALFSVREEFQDALAWCDVILVGPGLGKTESAKQLLEAALLKSDKPLVIDADGINLLAEDRMLLESLSNMQGRAVVLTPHIVELVRLLDAVFPEEEHSVSKVKKNFICSCDRLAKKLHIVLVAKDARTYICGEGKTGCLNVWGNSGMAVAGSGDILAGILASYMGFGLSAYQASILAVGIHAKAGDLAAEKYGEARMLPTDLLEEPPFS